MAWGPRRLAKKDGCDQLGGGKSNPKYWPAHAANAKEKEEVGEQMKLSKENLEIVKQLIDSAEEQSKAAILARQTWQMAIINSVEALDIRTHRMRTTDEILEALSGAMDSADPWLRENMSHIREYFALASRAVWSPSDLLIALTRLREDCNADPLTDFHVVGGAR